jgi:4-aminobutyrate aminotransferase
VNDMPRSDGLSKVSSRDRRTLAKAFATSGMILKRAYDVYIEDAEGMRYLDMTAGGTTAIGYGHPELAKALAAQISKGVDHVDRRNAVSEIAIELAEEVRRFLPPRLSRGKVVFGHSGSDIVEKAIRLVRFANSRPMMVSYYSAHHGANATALSASPTLKEMGTNPIAQFFSLPGFLHVPFPDPYRPWSGDGSNVGRDSLAFLERLLTSVVSPGMVAGVIVEPILSYGGNVVPPEGYFQELARLCKEKDIPLVDDEVLTGIGKTGRMLAMEHWEVCPDVVCLGKALSGPLPLAMLVAEEGLADRWESKDYVGVSKDAYPLGCAAAIAILRIVDDERLVQNAERVGRYLSRRLEDLVHDTKIRGEVRGKGLMMAVDLVRSEESRAPDTALARSMVSKARDLGLIVGLIGPSENIIRFLPSLTVREEHVDSAVETLGRAYRASK